MFLNELHEINLIKTSWTQCERIALIKKPTSKHMNYNILHTNTKLYPTYIFLLHTG